MNEHAILLSELFSVINKNSIKIILDSGSGRTSLNNLAEQFPNAKIDAIVYYGDERKKKSIYENVKSRNFELIEKDIVKDKITKKYDLVLAHLLLGEALTWGNTVEELLDNLLNIETKYLIIVDIKEDVSIDYEYLEATINKKYKIIKKEEIRKEEPQVFKNFISKNYVGYVVDMSRDF